MSSAGSLSPKTRARMKSAWSGWWKTEMVVFKTWIAPALCGFSGVLFFWYNLPRVLHHQ